MGWLPFAQHPALSCAKLLTLPHRRTAAPMSSGSSLRTLVVTSRDLNSPAGCHAGHFNGWWSTTTAPERSNCGRRPNQSPHRSPERRWAQSLDSSEEPVTEVTTRLIAGAAAVFALGFLAGILAYGYSATNAVSQMSDTYSLVDASDQHAIIVERLGLLHLLDAGDTRCAQWIIASSLKSDLDITAPDVLARVKDAQMHDLLQNKVQEASVYMSGRPALALQPSCDASESNLAVERAGQTRRSP